MIYLQIVEVRSPKVYYKSFLGLLNKKTHLSRWIKNFKIVFNTFQGENHAIKRKTRFNPGGF